LIQVMTDAQVNHHHIPVNAPKCPFHSYHRDGAMRTDGNLGRTPIYFPNSLGEWTDQPQLNERPLEITGAAAHWDHRVDDDHWQQPGNLFRNMNPQQKQALFDNTANQVGGASKHIQERHVANCTMADPAHAKASPTRSQSGPLSSRARSGPRAVPLREHDVGTESHRRADHLQGRK
jgi:catalase